MIAPWARDEVASGEIRGQAFGRSIRDAVVRAGRPPILSIPAACGGRAEMKAAYRFFDNEKVTFEKVLEPHIAQTKERMAEQKVVLLVQDTTEVDLTRPEQEVEGAGELDGPRRGVLLHEMHAFTPDGLPLGTAWAEVLNRTEGVSHEARGREITQAEAKADRREGKPPLAQRPAGGAKAGPGNA